MACTNGHLLKHRAEPNHAWHWGHEPSSTAGAEAAKAADIPRTEGMIGVADPTPETTNLGYTNGDDYEIPETNSGDWIKTNPEKN